MRERRRESAKSRDPVAGLAVLLLIFAFALFFGALAIRQHQTFLTNGLDLGNVDQALWNTAQGRLLQFTLMAPVESRLALHVEPILLLFVPFYWLNLGGPAFLLAAQAMVVALGAWPLYQLARHANPQAGWPAVVFPLAYLLLPTLESAVLFDFHAVTLAPTFLLFAFLALARQQPRRFFAFAVLAMACKEDMPLVVAMLGLYAALAYRRWRWAAATIALSAAWFGLAFFVIQPTFAAGGNIQLDRYAWLGSNPAVMLRTAVTQPGLVLDHLLNRADLPGYLFNLLFPTAFLALLNPLTLLPMLPSLAVNLLSDNPFTWRLEDFHYGAPLAPFLFISAIYAVMGRSGDESSPASLRLRAFTPLALTLILLASATYHLHRGFTPLARPFDWPAVTAHHQQLADLLDGLPDNVPLFAQSNLAPHLSQRPTLYADFAYFTDPAYPAAVPASDILLDVTSLENQGGLHQYLRQTLLESGDYRLAAAGDGLLHLQPAAAPGSPIELPPAFYTFTQADTPPAYPLRVDFGDALRLHGYSLHFNRQEEVQVTVDLEALRPLAGVQPVLYLLDAEGQPIGATTDPPPALVWLPVEQWPTGQIMRVRFNTLPWHTRATPAYRLALGVSSGTDPWDVSQRHRPALGQPAPWALRLPAAGTLLELARVEHIWSMPRGGPPPRRFGAPPLPLPLRANFGGQLTLLGYRPPQLSETELTLTLYWQAAAAPEPLVRFAQLIGPDGQIYGQQDSAPDRGHYPTPLWRPGEVVIETVTLPLHPNRPPGRYTLHVGLYHPATGERLRLPSGGDHVEIAMGE